jgi:hypothetical protein
MKFDLRIPMGLLFLVIGCVLTTFGLVTRGSEIYARSGGLNIDLVWGMVLLVSGAAMLATGVYVDRRKATLRT